MCTGVAHRGGEGRKPERLLWFDFEGTVMRGAWSPDYRSDFSKEG